MKCIYCLKEAEKSAFLKSEHVLPQSFGKFKNNLTLIGKVCDECNSGFGESIELALAPEKYQKQSEIPKSTRYKTKRKVPGTKQESIEASVPG